MVLRWPRFCLHLPRRSISVLLETTDVPKAARRVYILAANDVHMKNPVGQTRVPGDVRPRTTATVACGCESMMMNSKNHLMKPLLHVQLLLLFVVQLLDVFYSGFLDDDEPSAVLSPKYRDELMIPLIRFLVSC